MEVFGDNLLRRAVSHIALLRGARCRRRWRRSLRSHDPIDAAGLCLLGLKRQSELLLNSPSKKAPDRMRLPSRDLRNGRDGGPARGPKQTKHTVVLGASSA